METLFASSPVVLNYHVVIYVERNVGMAVDASVIYVLRSHRLQFLKFRKSFGRHPLMMSLATR